MKKGIHRFLMYIVLIIIGFILIYPLLWMFLSSFKSDNMSIFGTINPIPTSWTLDGYLLGWNSWGQFDFGHYYVNTFLMVVPTVLFTVVSSTIVGYGFARFEFPLKKVLFSLMIATLMLPNAVIVIPRYMLFNNFGWINSYLPFIVPAAFAGSAFFIFLMVQFFRGIPRELDESAKMDGCGSLRTFVYILLPLAKPAVVSVTVLQFIWTWNDFFNSMIFINSVDKYTLPLALRLVLDVGSSIAWNQVLAMSVLSIFPCVILFFFCQRYFVEGIATTGLKG